MEPGLQPARRGEPTHAAQRRASGAHSKRYKLNFHEEHELEYHPMLRSLSTNMTQPVQGSSSPAEPRCPGPTAPSYSPTHPKVRYSPG